MRDLGFHSVPCGPDGPKAWAIADMWEQRWQLARRGDAPSPALVAASNLSPDQIEAKTIYPPKPIGDGFKRFRRTPEWARKSPRHARGLVARLEANQADLRRRRPADGDARGPVDLAPDDRGDGITPRGAPGHEDLAGALGHPRGAPVLRCRQGPFEGRREHRARRPASEVARGRGSPAGQGRLAPRLPWAGLCDGRCMGYPSSALATFGP